MKKNLFNMSPSKASLRTYGITEKNFNDLMKLQREACAICLESFHNTRPNIDHNHTTQEVRGLLCSQCNMGIGALKDAIPVLQNAITYLRFPIAFELEDIDRDPARLYKKKKEDETWKFGKDFKFN